MRTISKWREAGLSVIIQKIHLDEIYPTSKCKVFHGRLTWEGNLQPTPFSRNYHVRLDYQFNQNPIITVVAPVLAVLANGRKLEHVYPGDHPCVWYPTAKEWTPGKSIAKTIIPWVIEWLAHFEYWLFTGVWSGGGIHPNGANA